jgi:hypothetical protein
MGKFLIIMTGVAAVAAGLVMSRSAAPSVLAERERSATAISEMLAEQYAASGLNDGAQWLAGHSTVPPSHTLEATIDGGRYVVTIEPASRPDQVIVRSTGFVSQPSAGGVGAEIRRVREVVYEFGAAGAGGGGYKLPPFITAAATMNRMFTANGNVTIESAVQGVNASVRTNGSAQANTNNHVTGFLYHADPIHDAGIRSRLMSVFQPNANPDNLPKLQQVPRVEIPWFTPQSFRGISHRQTNGNLFLSGDVMLGTAENPVIWYVDGDLITQGANTVIHGHGVFVVRQNVNINQHLYTSDTVGRESTVGFYMGGTMNINGGLSITGQIIANHDINIGGNSTIRGSITTASGVNFNGGSRLVYREPSAKLLEPFYDLEPADGEAAGGRARPVAYRSW